MEAKSLTVTGRYFDFLNPTESNFNIQDISHALSNMCRFAGHVREFYSVGQHSVIVSQIVPKNLAMWGLLHDASEAFMCDIAKPLKNLLPDYQKIEKRVESAIFQKFNLGKKMPVEVKKEVKYADMVLLATEKRDVMMNDDYWEVLDGFEALDKILIPVPPKEARIMFLERYNELLRDDEVFKG